MNLEQHSGKPNMRRTKAIVEKGSTMNDELRFAQRK